MPKTIYGSLSVNDVFEFGATYYVITNNKMYSLRSNGYFTTVKPRI